MTQDEPWTIGRLLTWTTEYLKKQGSESARLDSELLLAAACECQRIELYTQFDVIVVDDIRAKFRELVKQRASGKPVAYLLGFKEFYSLEFQVNANVLIPRPETEHLVVETLDRLKQWSDAQLPEVIDIGTGSGAIVITLAKNYQQATYHAVDVSSKALQIAQKNAQTHQVDHKIKFYESDLFQAITTDQQFDLIVSNPPYIGEVEKETLPTSVLEFEPHLALFSGEDGLELISCLIQECDNRLKAGGWLLFELSPIIAERVEVLIANSGLFNQSELVKDFANLPRVLIARRK